MRILRLPEVQAKTGLKHTTIYQRMNECAFPKPIALGAKARGWIEAEVDAWICERVTERDGKAA